MIDLIIALKIGPSGIDMPIAWTSIDCIFAERSGADLNSWSKTLD